jgi:integrase
VTRGGTSSYSLGKRVRESAKTASKTVAKEAEKSRRRELERTLAGLPAEKRQDRIGSVDDVVKTYLAAYGLTHRAKSILFAESRLAQVSRLLGSMLLPDLTQTVVHDYMRIRLQEGVAGRTINMELGELSRAMGQPWSLLWPKVRKMEERKDVGKALSVEEEDRLLDAIRKQLSPNRSQVLGAFVRIALLTGMRSGEITGLTWARSTSRDAS